MFYKLSVQLRASSSRCATPRSQYSGSTVRGPKNPNDPQRVATFDPIRRPPSRAAITLTWVERQRGAIKLRSLMKSRGLGNPRNVPNASFDSDHWPSSDVPAFSHFACNVPEFVRLQSTFSPPECHSRTCTSSLVATGAGAMGFSPALNLPEKMTSCSVGPSTSTGSVTQPSAVD
jgi:hypothetical protein